MHTIKKSNTAIIVILFFLLGSVAIIFTLPLMLSIQLFLMLFLLLYGIFIFPPFFSVKALRYTGDGWKLFLRDRVLDAALSGDSTVTRWVCILRFSIPDRRWKYACVIFRDAMTKEAYRRLVVEVRFSRLKQAETAEKLL